MLCNTCGMGVDERRERLARAGAWLREARSRRYPKAVDFARALGIERSLLSRYETGASEVPDERAETIARVLGIDIITVRRNLGLWVPDERSPMDQAEAMMDENERLVAELLERVRRLNRRKQEALLDMLEDDPPASAEPH